MQYTSKIVYAKDCPDHYIPLLKRYWNHENGIFKEKVMNIRLDFRPPYSIEQVLQEYSHYQTYKRCHCGLMIPIVNKTRSDFKKNNGKNSPHVKVSENVKCECAQQKKILHNTKICKSLESWEELSYFELSILRVIFNSKFKSDLIRYCIDKKISVNQHDTTIKRLTEDFNFIRTSPEDDRIFQVASGLESLIPDDYYPAAKETSIDNLIADKLVDESISVNFKLFKNNQKYNSKSPNLTGNKLIKEDIIIRAGQRLELAAWTQSDGNVSFNLRIAQ